MRFKFCVVSLISVLGRLAECRLAECTLAELPYQKMFGRMDFWPSECLAEWMFGRIALV